MVFPIGAREAGRHGAASDTNSGDRHRGGVLPRRHPRRLARQAGRPSGPGRAAAGRATCACAVAAARMDRRGRRLRPSADEGVRDPRRRRQFRELPRRAVAARRQAQHLARYVRQVREGPDARPADHGPGGLAARVHQGVLGLSRHPGERRARAERPGDAGQAQGGLRQGREGLWRRPLHHHRDLGRGVRTTARSAATAR